MVIRYRARDYPFSDFPAFVVQYFLILYDAIFGPKVPLSSTFNYLLIENLQNMIQFCWILILETRMSLFFFSNAYIFWWYTIKNLTIKTNLFQRSESTMFFVVESVRIWVDSTQKLDFIQSKMKVNSIFEFNQLELDQQDWILVSNFL